MRLNHALASLAVVAAALPLSVQPSLAAEPDLSVGILCFAVTESSEDEEVGIYTSVIDEAVMNQEKPVEVTILTREGGDPSTVKNRSIAQLELESDQRFTGETVTGGVPDVPIAFELGSDLSTIEVEFLDLTFSGECR